LKNIEQILNFIVEVEKLKSVVRKTRPVGLDRYENSAEHSWHVCLLALMLKDHANDQIDIDKVIRMLLIHDLGEIDAGDTIIYQSEKAELKEEELRGVERLLDILPDGYKDEYIPLWLEFENGETAESRYARAIDRIPPLLHNLHGEGHAWKENDITKEMVLSVNARIGQGSSEVWDVILGKLEYAIEVGILK
jgi:putative hydrolases of HD superfamily